MKVKQRVWMLVDREDGRIVDILGPGETRPIPSWDFLAAVRATQTLEYKPPTKPRSYRSAPSGTEKD